MVTNPEPPPYDELRLFGGALWGALRGALRSLGSTSEGALRTATNKCSPEVLPLSVWLDWLFGQGALREHFFFYLFV